MYLFKKISAIVSLLLIIFCLSFAFVGCDNPEDELPPDTRPTINIGSDEYTPYFYIDESGNYAGIDVEIATEAFSRMGYRANYAYSAGRASCSGCAKRAAFLWIWLYIENSCLSPAQDRTS